MDKKYYIQTRIHLKINNLIPAYHKTLICQYSSSDNINHPKILID